MSAPIRIQRSRAKGWRMPANTISVSRPSEWGNPFIVGEVDHVTGERIGDRAHAVRLFEQRWFNSGADWQGVMLDAARAALRGHNLACWCPLDQPCHADVLLRLANAPEA